MASTLRFLDSFAHYTDAQGTRKWTSFSGALPASIPGRWGGPGLNPSPLNLYLTLPTTGLFTVAAGVAYSTTLFSNNIHQFHAPGGSLGADISFEHVGDGRLRVVLGSVVIAGPSAFIMHLGTFYYLEVALMIGHFSGADQIQATAWANGVQILSGSLALSGLPFGPHPYTDYALNRYVHSGSTQSILSDLYITGSETTGDAALVYGDTAVYAQRPASDFGTPTWVPSTAGGHYAMVDDATPDDSATILSDGSTGSEDLHGLTAVNASPNSPTILGAQFLACTQKNAAGPATYVHVYNEAATDYLDPGGATYSPSAGSWLYSREVQENNIDGSGVWTPTTLNALKFGLRRTV